MAKLKRVNLGSGNDYLEGWINVDIDPDAKVDVVADLSSTFPFKDNSIDEIKASDILEHFTKEDGVRFLTECHRVLRQRGKIFIRTHDLYEIFRKFSNDPLVMAHFIYGDTSQTGVFGAHKYAYTKESLRFVLKKTGFEIESHRLDETNHVVVAVKKPKKEKNLRIAIIQQTPDIGGAETYMHSLVKNFVKKNHKVYLSTNLQKYSDMYSDLHVHIDKVPYLINIIGNWKGLVKAIFSLPFIFIVYLKILLNYKKDNIDVILMSNFGEKMLVTFLTKIIFIPVVWIEYGRVGPFLDNNYKIPKIVYTLLKSIPKSIIVPSKNTQQSLIVDARVSLAKLRVIPCGTEIYSKKIKKPELSTEFKNKFVIGNISRMTREKGQQIIINAAPHILKVIPEARFILVGDGPDRDYFQSLINSLKLEKYFILTGFVEKTDDYYSLMDIFIFPTIWELEGFGVVAIEAMMREIPVIASDFGPIPEIIEDYRTGLLFKPGDGKDLSEKVINLAKNSKLRKALAQNALKKAREEYAIAKISEKVLEVLTDATL